MIIDSIINIYVKILNVLYKYTKRIPIIIRNIIIFLVSFYFAYYKFREYCPDDSFFIFDTSSWLKIMLVSFALLIIVSNDRPVEKPQYNKFLTTIYILELIGVIIRYIILGANIGFDTDFRKDDLYILSLLFFIFVFPFVYIVWNNRKDYETLFDRLALASSILGFLYFINLFFLANKGTMFLEEGNILNASANFSTRLGLFYVIFAASSLYLIYRFSNKYYISIFACASFAISVVIIWWTICRAALLGLIPCIIATFIYTIKNIDKNNYKTKLINIMKYILIITLFLFISFSIKDHLTSIQLSRANQTFKREADFNHKYGEDYGFLQSSRFNIWAAYIKKFNFLGNKDELIFKDDGTRYVVPHNSIIEFTYKFGIINGLLYTIKLFYIALKCLYLLSNKKIYNSYSLFLILIMFTFACCACFDHATTLFSNYHPLIFYLAMIPLFDTKISIDKNSTQK